MVTVAATLCGQIAGDALGALIEVAARTALNKLFSKAATSGSRESKTLEELRAALNQRLTNKIFIMIPIVFRLCMILQMIRIILVEAVGIMLEAIFIQIYKVLFHRRHIMIGIPLIVPKWMPSIKLYMMVLI